MIKIKLVELNKKEVHEAIQALEAINLKAKASYKVGKFARSVKKEMEVFQEEANKISARFNEEHPAIKNKELLREEGMTDSELFDKWEKMLAEINTEFSKEMDELMDEEITIEVSPLELDEIGDKEVPPIVFEWLPFFIVDVSGIENKE